MKISLNQSELSKVYKLLEYKQINISLADMLLDFFINCDIDLMSKNEKEYFQKMKTYWGIDPLDKEDNAILDKQVGPYIKSFIAEELTNNPYFKNVRFKPVSYKEYELKYLTYEPFTPFAYDDVDIDGSFKEYSKVGYFKEKINYPVITHKKDIWMLVNPNEINTMKPYIDQANGSILVYGLGLGYYQYMVHLKDSVSKITIIEKDENVIKLFKDNILPYFDHKEKINIIHDDALTYKDNYVYDYVFADIWHDPYDGLPLYLELKKKEKNNGKTKYGYWLEKSLLAYLRRYMLTLIEEVLHNVGEEAYQTSQSFDDEVIINLYHKTKNITLKSYADVLNLLSDNSLLHLARS